MNKPNTTCRVCGKQYFCCQDSKNINSWRAMACSPECFKEYMRRIEESRKSIAVDETLATVSETKITEKTTKATKKRIQMRQFKTDDIIED